MKWHETDDLDAWFCRGAATCSGSPLRAQLAPPNEMGVRMGHLHLNVRDTQANENVFLTMGGTYQVQKVSGRQ